VKNAAQIPRIVAAAGDINVVKAMVLHLANKTIIQPNVDIASLNVGLRNEHFADAVGAAQHVASMVGFVSGKL